MRLRNGADAPQETVTAVVNLLKKMDVPARQRALSNARNMTGYMRGHRMTPLLANIIISAVKDDGSLQSPYAEEKQ